MRAAGGDFHADLHGRVAFLRREGVGEFPERRAANLSFGTRLKGKKAVRALWLSALFVTPTVLASCSQKAQLPVIVHVLRDPSATFAAALRQADTQFALTRPRLQNGKRILVATNEAGSYQLLLQRTGEMPPTMLIASPEPGLPNEVLSRAHLATKRSVCGGQAYVFDSVSGEEQQAANLYLHFLEAHCPAR